MFSSLKYTQDSGGVTRLLKNGKRNIIQVICGRTTVIILLLLLQVALLFSAFQVLEQYVYLFFGGAVLLRILMLIYLLNTSHNPAVKLSWGVVIAVAPIFGAAMYWFIQLDLGHRAEQRLMQKVLQESAAYVTHPTELLQQLKKTDPDLYHTACYTERFGGFPIYENTTVKYLALGEQMLEEMLIQLQKAKKFIFLEYFIIEEGEMWGKLLHILIQKAKEGVDVRVMYDGTCAFSTLPMQYPKKLRQQGIQCKVFAPIHPLVSTHYNNRDHRKILVIDGEIGFTGGINLADEYINKKKRFGHWKDTAVMLQGDAVRSLTYMFLQMWNATQKERIYEPYLLAPNSSPPAKGYVIPFGDSPLDDEKVGEMIYLNLLQQAKEYVYIMTPYLILDNEMLTALTFAAKRGIDVRLILPHIPDKQYTFVLAKTHYKELLAAGVKIYEYTPGFVHAKMFVSDHKKAVVGTVNLDYRSLYLHFECAAYLHDVPAIADIDEDFIRTLEKCQQITMEDVKAQGILTRAAGAMLKVIAPLM